MNKKGQMVGVGIIITIFVALVFGLTMYTGAIAPSIGAVTNTIRVVNQSQTFPSVTEATVVKLTNVQAVSNFEVYNGSSGELVDAANYTITNYALCDGNLCVRINGTFATTNYVGDTVNFTYTAEPLGYVTSGGGRSLVSIIAILVALALVAYSLSPQIKELADYF